VTATAALCPCLDAVFPGVPTIDALRRSAALGFSCVEFWDWRARDVEALGPQAAALGLQVAVFSGNTFAEPLMDPAKHEHALAHLRRSLEVAGALGTRVLVMHVGYALAGRSRAEQWRAAVAGVRAAAALAAEAGITLVVEPLNSVRDHPGYFLDSVAGARRLLDDVGHPAVRVLADVYHMSLMDGGLLAQLAQVVHQTAHVHLADAPGRGEPGSGTIPWPEVVRLLREGGYEGPLGLECWPTSSPEDALRRAAAALES
jgi:hydroxypyruvate isomerase